MASDDWSDRRLDDLARQTDGLLASYGALMQSVARLDERADTADRERREIRDMLTALAVEMRSGLAAFDASCARKVDALGEKMDTSAKETRKDIKDEIHVQVGLQMAQAEKARQWSPSAKAAVAGALITTCGAVLVALLT